MTHTELPAHDDMLWDYTDVREREKKFGEEINVRLEPDGSVTMTGLSYRDFSSLMTAASLHRYSESDKLSPSHRDYVKALEDQARGEPESYPGRIDILKQNAHEDRCWRNDQRAILAAIKGNLDAALSDHNRSYSKVERLYYKLTGWTFWPRLRFYQWKRAITKFFKSR